MSDFLDRISGLSRQRLMLLAADLRERLERQQLTESGAVAVVGASCRFPLGADGLDAYWRLLREGVDAIRQVPPDRWDVDRYFDTDPDKPGKMVTRWGAFIDDVDRFDAEFFRISPREAEGMDPQQRLLLEVGWHALEDAGIAPDKLEGSRTGVYVGLCSNDYFQLQAGRGPEAADTYLATGGADSVASGRLSYVLGLQGPSVSIDTACSSSLTAVHMACRGLRHGDCDMALAGGANVLLWPEGTITMSRGRMMAPDGRCKTFDARADGFVRGEGCGVVVLKRLQDAQRNRDRILAVIRGSAINQDGRSNGLTAPNGPSQEAVIRAALADAGVDPAEVGYVEAHGTGTPLGDPIEIHALGAVLGEGRSPDCAVAVGSAKTNLGHLEAAAGIAGLLKAVLMVRHGEVPPHLHFQAASPHIDWDAYPVRVPTRLESWDGGPRIAGVSSFGFSGSNAHVIVGEAPPARVPEPAGRSTEILPVSARDPEVLRRLSGDLATHLTSGSGTSLADVSATLGAGRAHHEERLAVVADCLGEAVEGLSLFHEGGELEPGTFTGSVGRAGPPRIAFLYSGQGSQRLNMGRDLFDASPVFRDAILKCEALLEPCLDHPLTSVLFGDDPSSTLLDRTRYSQPAVFALQIALTELWRSWGIEPDVVVGHSAGEYAAACVSGVFTLEDGAALIAERARLVEGLPPGGAMAAILTDPARVAERVAEARGPLSVAAENGPAHAVISGQREAVEEVARGFEAEGVDVRRLAVDHASHSPLMEPLLAPLEAAVARRARAAPRYDFVSTVTGTWVSDEILAPSYWARHARGPVRFSRAIDEVLAGGITSFLEIGPHTTLVGMGAGGRGDRWLASLRKGQGDWRQILGSLAELYVAGADVAWSGVASGRRTPVALPSYPFRRDRHWLAPEDAPHRGPPRPRRASPDHPLLDAVLVTARDEAIFEAELTEEQPRYLADHVVHGRVIVPAPVFMELALAAAVRAGPAAGAVALRNFVIHRPLDLSGAEPVAIQVLFEGRSGGRLEIFAREGAVSSGGWRLHASCTTDIEEEGPSRRWEAAHSVRARCQDTVSGSEYYDQLRERGVAFGPAFRGIVRIARRDGEAIAEVEATEALAVATEGGSYHVHPAFLDACLQSLGAALPAGGTQEHGDETFLLVGLDRYRTFGWIDGPCTCHARLHPAEPNTEILVGDVVVRSARGDVVAELEGIRLKKARRSSLTRPAAVSDWLYRVTWVPSPAPAAGGASAAPRLPELLKRLGPAGDLAGHESSLSTYRSLTERLDGLAAGYVRRAFEDLVPGGARNGFPGDLPVADRHVRLLRHLTEVAQEQMTEEAAVPGSERVPTTEDLIRSADALRRDFPDYQGEVDLLERCGSEVGDVLRGLRDPLELLFPGGTTGNVEALTTRSPVARAYNALIARVLEELTALHPPDRGPLRVLEVGAGTGGTTDAVAGVVAESDVEYHFTDISHLFVEKARERFGRRGAMRFGILDIERDPGEQGFAPGSFDVVIAANVVHATRDLKETLGHVRSLLAPGGVLVLLEGSGPQCWVDLTFGLTEGWWRFHDDAIRASHPLLPADRWPAVLADGGFDEVTVLPGGDVRAHMGRAAQALVLATRRRRPSGVEDGAGRWLLVAGGDDLASKVVEGLEARGHGCVTLGGDLTAETVVEALAEPDDHGRPWLGVIHLLSTCDSTTDASGVEDVGETANVACRTALEVVKGMIAGLARPPRLWLVTAGAQGGPADDAVLRPAQAPTWGLGRTVANEHPELWGGLIDLDPRGGDAAADQVLLEVGAETGEDEVLYRRGRRFVSRLVREPELASSPVVALDPEASYLVTGGTGGIGLATARWLVESGAAHVHLVARREPSVVALRTIESLRETGASVEVHQGDVAQQREMAAILAHIDGTSRPLRGVFHVAGIFDDRVLTGLDWPRFERVLAPKVRGGWILHSLTRDRSLDFFTLFSSGASFLGPVGLANYAAANAFVDVLALHRRRMGLPAASVAWGPWEDTGMAAAVGSGRRDQWDRAGFGVIPIDTALEVLGRISHSGSWKHMPQLAVLPARWDQYQRELGRVRPLFQDLVQSARSRRPSSSDSTAATSTFRQELESTPTERRHERLADWVREQVRRVLGFRSGRELDPDRGFFDLGMDSLTAVELKNRLQEGLGLDLPATVVFDDPSVTALVGRLADDLHLVSPATPAADAETSASQDAMVLSEEDLAARLAAKLTELG